MVNKRILAYVFVAFVLITGLLIGLSMAQSDNASIEYDYSSNSVDYNLSNNLFSYINPYNFSETVEEQSFSVGGSGEYVSWENDGTYLFTTGSSGNVERHTATSPHGQLTAENTFDVGGARELGFGPDGTNYYLLDSNSVLTSSTVLPWQPNSNNVNQVTSTFGTIRSGDFSQGGDLFVMLVENPPNYEIQTFNVPDPYNLNSVNAPPFLTTAATFSAPDGGVPAQMDITSEGVFISVDSGIYQYDDFTSMNQVNSYSVPSGYDNLYGISLSNDGEVAALSGVQNSVSTISRNTLEHSNTIDIQLEDTDGNVLSGTEQTISSSSGSVQYQSDLYEQLRLYYERAVSNQESGYSNTITIYGSGEIDIREERTNNLVTQDVNVTAYGEESGIYSLDTSDGTIDITGLPDQAYTFTVSSGGYVQRNKYVEELGNVENLYLLSNQSDRVTTQFLLEDTTNTYDSESRLIIERSIEGNGNDWETIYSDSFGTEGVSVELQQDVRYRISIENDERRQTLGPYRATLSESVTISPESGTIEVDSEGIWTAGATYQEDTINVQFNDSQDETDSVSVSIYERGNQSNTLAENDVYVSPSELRLNYNVPNQYNDTNWVVEITRESAGESTTISFQVGPNLQTVPPDLDPMWRNAISVIIILSFGLAFSVINRAVGAIVLALVGGLLWWVGWLAGATAGVLITAYLFIAIAYGIYTKSIR